jgi:hypothetical protein
MIQLRIAFLFMAVVAGDYAALRLIDCQLIDFGVAAAISAGCSVAAWLVSYAGKRRLKAVRRARAAVWTAPDQQAASAFDQQCPNCGGPPRNSNGPPRFVDRQGARSCGACAPALKPEQTR